MVAVEGIVRRVAERQALCSSLKELIVDRLCLDVESDWITDDQPLFGRGLELDSLDAVELAISVEHQFGVPISDDDVGVFASVNTLADFIEFRGASSPSE